MRCPDCNKFVGFDTESEPELDLSVDEAGRITGTARIVNSCAECSTELKETTFDIEDDTLVAPIEEHKEVKGSKARKKKKEEATHGLTMSDDGGSRTDRMEDKDRRGKPIKSARYMKHMYGFEVNVTVECECGESWSTTIADETSGSGMEEMV